MKNEQFRNYFIKLREKTAGDTSSNSDIIDWADGTSLTFESFKEEYYNYLELCENVDDYIDDNDLDPDKTEDSENIKKHFSNKIDEKFFHYNNGYLLDFIDYLIEKLNK